MILLSRYRWLILACFWHLKALAQEEIDPTDVFEFFLPAECRERRKETMQALATTMASVDAAKLELINACYEQHGHTDDQDSIHEFRCTSDLTTNVDAEELRQRCASANSRPYDVSYVQTCTNSPFRITDESINIPMCIPDTCALVLMEQALKIKLLGSDSQECDVEIGLAESNVRRLSISSDIKGMLHPLEVALEDKGHASAAFIDANGSVIYDSLTYRQSESKVNGKAGADFGADLRSYARARASTAWIWSISSAFALAYIS